MRKRFAFLEIDSQLYIKKSANRVFYLQTIYTEQNTYFCRAKSNIGVPLKSQFSRNLFSKKRK